MSTNAEYAEMKSKASEESDGTGFRYPPSKNLYLKIVLVVLAIFLIVTTVLAVAFIALYANSDDSSSSSSNVCQTEACFDLSVQILGNMDENEDPCQNFYNFTCGNWANFQGIKPGQ